MNKAKLVLAAAVLFSSTLAFGQDGYFSNWFQRVDKTQSEQPHWITPLGRLRANYRLTLPYPIVGYLRLLSRQRLGMGKGRQTDCSWTSN